MVYLERNTPQTVWANSEGENSTGIRAVGFQRGGYFHGLVRGGVLVWGFEVVPCPLPSCLSTLLEILLPYSHKKQKGTICLVQLLQG